MHRDCHVQFDRCFYSVPFTLIGQALWLRATDTAVAIYQDYRQVAVHPRGRKPGQRFTVRDHLPPEAQAYFAHDRDWCLQQATAVGPACAQLIDQLLADRIVERLRAAQGVLRLAERYGTPGWKPPAPGRSPTTARSTAPSRPFSPAASISNRCCMSPHRRARTVPARALPATPRILFGVEPSSSVH